jgi:hypothetical protein
MLAVSALKLAVSALKLAVSALKLAVSALKLAVSESALKLCTVCCFSYDKHPRSERQSPTFISHSVSQLSL